MPRTTFTNIKSHSKTIIIGVLVSILFGLSLFFVGIMLWSIRFFSNWLEPVTMFFPMALFCFRFGYASWMWALVEAQPTCNGLVVKYPLQKEKIVSWGEFQEICVCHRGISAQPMNPSYEPIICFVKKKEKKDIYGRWKADNPFRYKSVISLPYSDELLTKVRKFCPYQVPDLRQSRLYRNDHEN